MQAIGSYDELIRAINEETRQCSPAKTMRFGSLSELILTLEPVEKNKLFIVSAEPVGALSTSPIAQMSNPSSLEYDDLDSRDLSNNSEYDLVALSSRLEEYFSWFGEIDSIYLLGTSVAVFVMKHAFSVTHVLKSSLHEVGITEAWVPGLSPMVRPAPDRMVKANFTVHGYESDSLSLNTILALLKHVDPADVLMVRRVNRLGFNGKSLVKRYFQQYGKVLRVFMLPLRSRKKNVTLPSKTGFVVMASAKCCEVILKCEEHTIVPPDLSVSVGPFTHRGQITW
jgi:hypothetical protein